MAVEVVADGSGIVTAVADPPPFPTPITEVTATGWPTGLPDDEAIIVFGGGTPLYYATFVPDSSLKAGQSWTQLAGGSKVVAAVASGTDVTPTLTLNGGSGAYRYRWVHLTGLDLDFTNGVRHTHYAFSTSSGPSITSTANPSLCVAFCSLDEGSGSITTGIITGENYDLANPWGAGGHQHFGYDSDPDGTTLTASIDRYGLTAYNHLCMVEFAHKPPRTGARHVSIVRGRRG